MEFFSRPRRNPRRGVVYSPLSESLDGGSDKEGLLATDFDDLTTTQSLWIRSRSLILAHAILFGFYITTVAYLLAKLHSCSTHGPEIVPSPAWKAIQWQEHEFVHGEIFHNRSKYTGLPSQEIDQAWHDLLRNENIRIEPNFIKDLDREDGGVRVPGEDSYIGTLNVYHELHCLKRIYQYTYEDVYFPDLDEKQRKMNRMHHEHCIDYLRQSAMCHGDIGLVTYQWDPSTRIPMANTTTHQCVDWSKLEEWAEERSVDMLKSGWLVHPTLGVAFPEGEGDGIGVAG